MGAKKNCEIKRKNIHVLTLKKVEEFLKKQKEPVFKSDIVKKIKVDYDSVSLALTMIKIEIDKQGRVSLK
jgi:hypothetical protein